MNDYFTIEQFRAFAGEKKGGSFSEEDIIDAQSEVIDSLEAWAHSAWPQVIARGLGNQPLADETLTLTSGTFVAADDVGKAIRVVGAGEDGEDLETTIASVTDTTHAELADAAATGVTGASVYIDGDGRAATVRSATQESEVGPTILMTSEVPVIEVISLQIVTDAGTTTLDATDYTLIRSMGVLRLKESVRRGTAGLYQLTYSYGHTSCPYVVRRPAMQATLSLLKDTEPTKVPANVSQMTTEATTFLIGTAGTVFSGPWPWDQEASEALRSYWGRNRPRRAGAA